MNVAPEFGLVETDALLHLKQLEQKLLREGWLAEREASGFELLLGERSFKEAPWKKWMTDDVLRLAPEKVEADRSLRRLITRVCGHYLYHEPLIQDARRRMEDNVDRHGLLQEPAEVFVKGKVKEAIGFYVYHFHLEGLLEALVPGDAGQRRPKGDR
jgi:hypothetical protein